MEPNRVFYAKRFGYDFAQPAAKALDKSQFEEVAQVDGSLSLERLFREMNAVGGTELCCELKVRSMSTGDVVQKADGTLWLCAFCGWAEVQWAEQAS